MLLEQRKERPTAVIHATPATLGHFLSDVTDFTGIETELLFNMISKLSDISYVIYHNIPNFG